MTRVLGWLAVVALLAGLAVGFGVAPREVTQGNVQRIMYVHVPSVLVAYLAFAVVFVASVAYLARRAEAADRIAHASAEVGVLFTGITIATGSIWGKPTWGTWWTWDARLTSVAILFVMYLGYLLLRGMVEDRERGARYAAVLGCTWATCSCAAWSRTASAARATRPSSASWPRSTSRSSTFPSSGGAPSTSRPRS